MCTLHSKNLNSSNSGIGHLAVFGKQVDVRLIVFGTHNSMSTWWLVSSCTGTHLSRREGAENMYFGHS